MTKLSKDKRDKLTMVGVSTLAVVAIIYFYIISAQKETLQELELKIVDVKDKLATAERWQRMSATINEDLQSMRKVLDAKGESMAPVDKFKWFYGTIERFLPSYEVTLLDISRTPEISNVGLLPKFPFQFATFAVKFNGHFHDFGKFLADFENHFPYLRVQDLELKPEFMNETGPSDFEVQTQTRGAEKLGISLKVVTLVQPSIPF